MPGVVLLRLYLAGDGPNSLAARRNLERLLAGVDRAGYSLEVVDCLRDPLRALEQGVLVTPTLVRIEPEPVVTIIGTLRDSRGVMDMLGLVGAIGAAGAAGVHRDPA